MAHHQLRAAVYAAIFHVVLIHSACAGENGALTRSATDDLVTQIVVKFPESRSSLGSGRVMTQSHLSTLTSAGGMSLTYKRTLLNGAHVLKLPYAMTTQDARAFAATVAANANVEYAEPDYRVRPSADVVPTDPQYASQWGLDSARTFAGAANLPAAWGMTTGSNAVTVAVVDTGVTNHTDFKARLVGGSAATSGYDFISDVLFANDGSGRDSDPSDPGDWMESTELTADCPDAMASSWHGTHVAGIIGASANNARGGVGVDWSAKVLSARVLGKCGGSLSDVADAIVWSAGGAVSNVPTATRRANVINLSLGAYASGAGCPSYIQAAINAAVNRGAVVVVAAGNEASDAVNSIPANCQNVIAVAGVDTAGYKMPLSNYGSRVDIAAPGDMIYSTYNAGADVPAADTYAWLSGTSMATPHVSGVVALMMAANPNLTNGTLSASSVARVVENNLKASARAMPDKSVVYGAGLLDAHRALLAVTQSPSAVISAPSTVAATAKVSLNGAGSKNNTYGTTALAGYQWIQTAGTPVTLSNANTATATFTAPSTVGEVLVFKLTVTNDVGMSSSSVVEMTTTAAPASTSTSKNRSSGGGGSLDIFLFGLLGLMAGGVRWFQRRNNT